MSSGAWVNIGIGLLFFAVAAAILIGMVYQGTHPSQWGE